MQVSNRKTKGKSRQHKILTDGHTSGGVIKD